MVALMLVASCTSETDGPGEARPRSEPAHRERSRPTRRPPPSRPRPSRRSRRGPRPSRWRATSTSRASCGTGSTDPSTALAPATATLAAADIAIVNLETAVGSGGRPEPGKRFTFQAPPKRLRRARRRRHRRGDDGQQPRPRLRPGAAARHVRGHRGRGDLRSTPCRGRDRTERRPRRSSPPGPTSTARSSPRSGPRSPEPTPPPTPPGSGPPLTTLPGPPTPWTPRACSAPSNRLTGRPTWSSSTCTGVSRARPAPTGCSGPWRPGWSRRAPTSSSAVMRTRSRATAGSARLTSPTGWGTTPGTPSPRTRRRSPAC